MNKYLKCSELEHGREIVFKVDPYHKGNKELFTGHVIYVNNKTVCVSYLEGYKSRTDDIPFEDCVAAYDKDGEMMSFGDPCCIRGNSVLLSNG